MALNKEDYILFYGKENDNNQLKTGFFVHVGIMLMERSIVAGEGKVIPFRDVQFFRGADYNSDEYLLAAIFLEMLSVNKEATLDLRWRDLLIKS
jgi:hypothetical protein